MDNAMQIFENTKKYFLLFIRTSFILFLDRAQGVCACVRSKCSRGIKSIFWFEKGQKNPC